MLAQYQPLFPAPGSWGRLVEPFAGGAALFNHLSGNSVIPARLGDINAEIMGVYRLVRDDPEDLIRHAQALEREWMPRAVAARKALYYELRAAYWSATDGPETKAPETTALLYFLMKTGFNGIWQTCAASKGRYGTPVGLASQRDRVIDPAVIRTWSWRLSQTDLASGPYGDIVVEDGSFVFCDPPYRDSFTSYGTSFDDKSQIDLIAWCRSIRKGTGSVVWLSNRDAGDGFFEKHPPDATIHRFPVIYTAGRRKRTEDGFAARRALEVLLTWG